MFLRGFGKFALGFLTLFAGIGIFAATCSDERCEQVISSILTEAEKNQKQENIQLEAPNENSVAESPLEIRGTARVFEGTLFYEIRDSLGYTLAEGELRTDGTNMKQFLKFHGFVLFNPAHSPTGKLQLFDRSPKDDSIIDLITIPLIFPSSAIQK